MSRQVLKYFSILPILFEEHVLISAATFTLDTFYALLTTTIFRLKYYWDVLSELAGYGYSSSPLSLLSPSHPFVPLQLKQRGGGVQLSYFPVFDSFSAVSMTPYTLFQWISCYLSLRSLRDSWYIDNLSSRLISVIGSSVAVCPTSVWHTVKWVRYGTTCRATPISSWNRGRGRMIWDC